MQPRTDLAMEAKALYERSAQEQTKLSGVIAREQERHGVRMTVVKITSAEGEQALGKPRGTYITAELEALTRREPGSFSNAARTVGRALRELLSHTSCRPGRVRRCRGSCASQPASRGYWRRRVSRVWN